MTTIQFYPCLLYRISQPMLFFSHTNPIHAKRNFFLAHVVFFLSSHWHSFCARACCQYFPKFYPVESDLAYVCFVIEIIFEKRTLTILLKCSNNEHYFQVSKASLKWNIQAHHRKWCTKKKTRANHTHTHTVKHNDGIHSKSHGNDDVPIQAYWLKMRFHTFVSFSFALNIMSKS